MIETELENELHRRQIIAVMTVNDPKRAVLTAEALLRGGVSAIELTLRTPGAIECLRAVSESVPDMLVCAGTVITREQVEIVKAIGIPMGVAPGFNPDVVKAADRAGLSFAPGIMTPSDIEGALALGCRVLKYYHAGVAGGLKALKSMAAPYNHLGLKFIPLGGVDKDNLPEWFTDERILAVGGSWIAPSEIIDSENWDEITTRATAAAVFANRRIDE